MLEAAVRVAELAGEFDRGVMLAKAALREIDIDAEPVRAALLLQARGHLNYLLGRPGYTDDLREAARLVPADPPTPARARVLEALAHDIHHRVQLGRRRIPGRAPRRRWRWPGRPVTRPPKRPRWSPWPAPSRSAGTWSAPGGCWPRRAEPPHHLI